MASVRGAVRPSIEHDVNKATDFEEKRCDGKLPSSYSSFCSCINNNELIICYIVDQLAFAWHNRLV